MARLSGKAAIITGGGSGIGRATAKLFAAEGACVAVLERSGPAASEVEREIRAAGQQALALEVDLSVGRNAEDAVRRIAGTMDRVDILVNNAAISLVRSFDEVSLEEWQKVLDTDLTAYFLCARVAAREMRKQGGGAIVNIGSVHRMISEPGVGAYAAAKGAVAQLTRNLAIELAPDNIVVNSISPGFVRTPMGVIDGVDQTATEHFQNYYLKSGRIPLRRAALPEEIAAAVLFLASRECSYLTGADLVVDGGLTITL